MRRVWLIGGFLMKRSVLAVCALLAIGSITGLIGVVDLTRRADSDPVYTVAQLRATLLDAARGGALRAWAGREVRLRGVLVSGGYDTVCTPQCQSIATQYAMLAPPDALSGQPDVWMHVGDDRSILARLRSLPLLGNLLPSREAVRIGVEATYRVRLEDDPDPGKCGPLVCFDAVLLDVAPPMPASPVGPNLRVSIVPTALPTSTPG